MLTESFRQFGTIQSVKMVKEKGGEVLRRYWRGIAG